MPDLKIIDKEEAEKIVKKLQMKYGAENAKLMKAIERDIRINGFVSLETLQKQKDLKDRMLKEKEQYENQK